MKTKLVGISLAGLILGACTLPSNSNQIEPAPTENSSTTIDQREQKNYTAQEVANHNQESDCWIIIEENVYDITKFISLHPGGKIIAMACGKDATLLYNARGTRKDKHSQRADKLREEYFIGKLSSQ